MKFNGRRAYFSIMLFLVCILFFSAICLVQNTDTSQEYLNDLENKPLSSASWNLNGNTEIVINLLV